MTKDKAQKRAVRARMAKTGERYTTARRYALDLHTVQLQDDFVSVVSDGRSSLEPELANQVDLPTVSMEAAPLPPRVAEPGMSEAAVLRATGKSWDEWFALLDAWHGTTKTHAEIARHVHDAHGISGWWAQSVTVGYERARGMRALHERPDGFSMNVSKTFPVPVECLFAALVEAEERERWLEGITLHLRTSQPNRSARFDVTPGDVRLAATFAARGPEKASVALQQERLADAEEVARWKALWKKQLSRLSEVLTGRRGRES